MKNIYTYIYSRSVLQHFIIVFPQISMYVRTDSFAVRWQQKEASAERFLIQNVSVTIHQI